MEAVRYVQFLSFGAAIKLLRKDSPDKFDQMLKKLANGADEIRTLMAQMKWVPTTPSCFLGQYLAPNTPLGTFHDKGDLRNDYTYNATLAHKFWLSWVKGYLTNLQGRKKMADL